MITRQGSTWLKALHLIMSKLALIGKSSRIALFLLGGVLSSHWQKCFLKLDCKAHCDVFSYIFYCILGGIPHCERKELLQATLNVIQDDFPNEAIVDIIEFDAFNRLDIFPVWFYDHKTKINLVESITFNYVQVSLDWKII